MIYKFNDFKTCENILYKMQFEKDSLHENEFEVRLYPYNSDSNSGTFDLSQDYTDAQNLQIYSIKGYYFDESEYQFDLGTCYLASGEESIVIEAEMGINLQDFERVVVLFTFTSGVQSDYTQIRLLQDAIDNYPGVPQWTSNDTIYVDFEYMDLDYFILFEEYEVGSDDSMFEYLAYTRDKDFMPISVDSFEFTLTEQRLDVENFSKVDDPRAMLEMKDHDGNGEHEHVLEKHDITGDGIYDTFKIGFVNTAGEITYSTVIFEITGTESMSKRQQDITYTKDYRIQWNNNDYNALAQLMTITDSIITQRTDLMTTIIQTDEDLDGNMDYEVTYETIFSTLGIQSFVTKTFEISVCEHDGSLVAQEDLIEYSTVASNFYDVQNTLMFREFEGEELTSTRYYEDVFPNELADIFAMENFVQSIFHPATGVELQAPDMEGLLEFAQNEDNVPVVYDSITVINSHSESRNILTSSVSIPLENSMLGTLPVIAEIEELALNVIKVTPDEGVYYDLNGGNVPKSLPGGSYYYVDSDNDTRYETIFIVDDSGEVIATGFDYDSDCYFVPNKRTAAEVHVSSNMAELANKEYFKEVIDTAIEDKFIRLSDEDRVIPQATLGDSLFDLWKTQFMGYSSQLIEEARRKTSNEFIESITPQRILGDIVWQVASQTIAYLTGLLAGTLFAPTGLGPLASALGYFITYAVVNIANSIDQAKQAEAYIASQSHDVDIVHLNSKWSMDDIFGGWMTDVLLGSTTGVYTEVKHEGEDTEYTGQMVLAQGALSKAQWLILDILYLDIDMDYELQTRNYVGFSDGGELLEDFLRQTGYQSAHQAELNHEQNSLLYLEEQVNHAAAERGENLDKVYPYMFYGEPLMLFGEEEGGLAYPEFSEHRPIYVSEEQHVQVQDQVNHIFKVDDLSTMKYDHRAYKIDGSYLPTLELQILPEDSANTYDFEVLEVAAYVVNEWGLGCQYKYMGAFPAEELKFDSAMGILTMTSFTLNTIRDYYLRRQQEVSTEVKVIFQVSFEKYRPIDEESEQDMTIALMQAAQAATLRYYYQYELAEDSQQKLDEIAYTAFITAISQILTIFTTMGINALIGPSILKTATTAATGSKGLMKIASKVASTESATISNLFMSVVKEIGEEVFVDPLVEAITTAIVRNVFHGNQYDEIVWSTLAESGRETLTGGISSLLNLRQSRAQNQMVMEYLEMRSRDASTAELTSRQQFNEFKSFLEQNGKSAQNSLQEKVLKGATITLALLKVFTFAIGAGSIASLIALSGATFGLKGVNHAWTYMIKKAQVRTAVQLSAVEELQAFMSRLDEQEMIKYQQAMEQYERDMASYIRLFQASTNIFNPTMLLDRGPPTPPEKPVGLMGANEKFQGKIKATGTERVLLERIYEIIHPYITYAPRASLERVIGKILADIASIDGYTFNEFSIFRAIDERSKLSKAFLEQYEFLFKFSSVFSKSQREELKDAMKIYRKVNNIAVENLIHKTLMSEYNLVMMIREAYFVEHKEFLTLNALSKRIHNVKGSYSGHFSDATLPSFEKVVMFQIEQWCKKNLPAHFEEIQAEIDKWRVENNDNSVYANQATPLRSIAYDLLLLHYQEKDEILGISDLDRMLFGQEPSLGEDFFKRRIKPSTFDRSVRRDSMLLLKAFVSRNYDMRKKETKLLLNDIDAFIEIIPDRGVLKSHSPEFRDLYIFQAKQLIDITKGLDPLYCTFSFEEDLKSLTRQHTDEDPGYPFILFEFMDGTYVFKLAPLGFHTSHIEIHQNDGLSTLANEVVKARMKHLFELSLMEYDSSISEDEYIRIFEGLFSGRRDRISSLNSEENIWGEFGDGKVYAITDDTIVEFVRRWIDSKERSEQSWYDAHYKLFYRQKFMPWIKDIYNYMRNRSNVWARSEMCEWFINTYLRDEALFYHKSLDSFINNI